LTGDGRYDAVVVGAGSVGVPAAYFLASSGYRVLCLEGEPSSGQGQSKAAIGGVRATHSDPGKIQFCLKSLEIFSTWEERTGASIGWKKGGYCFPAFTEDVEGVLKGLLPIQHRHGLDIDWVDPDRIMELVPGINSRNLLGGTYSPDDGQVSPLMAMEAMEAEARRLGARFAFRERVTGFDMEKSGDETYISGVRTEKGVYAAGQVLDAAGASGGEIARMAGVDAQVMPDSHEAGITAPVKPFLDPLVVDLRPGADGRTSNFYFGQVESGQLIFCYTPNPLIPGIDRRCTSGFMPIIARRLVDLIPRFRNLLVRRVWRGLYPMTPDGVPIIGKAPGVTNMYLTVGMCGQGMMMGPGTGYYISKLMTTGSHGLAPEVFETFDPGRDFSDKGREALR
jgi:sarcosine oxidase subunit beta